MPFRVRCKYRHQYNIMADCGLLRVLLIFAIIVNDCCKSEKYYNREQGTGNRRQGTRGQGTGDRGTGDREQVTGKSQE
jgi:hypothetical protein